MSYNTKPIPIDQLQSLDTFTEFAQCVDYSLMDSLHADPEATDDGVDHDPRQVFSGHYVPVTPTPLPASIYVIHSHTLFQELGLSDALTRDASFSRLFSGDLSVTQAPMRPYGWATGYALSIYGTEYTEQCPFRTGNGYGDGRAISVFEGLFRGKRWEMQLKGSGPTPYCRGADGRAVLRSSVREFLAQEFMHALGVPTSRSLTLYVSPSEKVRRPWYSQDSTSYQPDILTENSVAISTRVAPSFIRVGQLELFARRARRRAHPKALLELQLIVEHLIKRNYHSEIDAQLPLNDQVVELAQRFRDRLISLVTHWLRVGYCQGNFNSDNCAAGGFTLDYGPFGFCELFNPRFQPWTGGGDHFSFFNQPTAAEVNFKSFMSALHPLLVEDDQALTRLEEIQEGFAEAMHHELEKMWAQKLGLMSLDESLLKDLFHLMIRSKVDYTIFFRELSQIPTEYSSLKKSFYQSVSEELDNQWENWWKRWYDRVQARIHSEEISEAIISEAMKRTNPKFTWREWSVRSAYIQAEEEGNYQLIRELQEVLTHPYDDLTSSQALSYDQLRPRSFFNRGGVSHYSCSS